MGKVRIWYRPDGKVSVSYPDVRPEKKPDSMTIDEWALEQFRNVAIKSPRFQNFPFDDVDGSSIPVNDGDRDRWRGSKGQGVSIDNTVVLRRDIEKQLDDELAKPNPSPIAALRLQRKLDKKEHD